MRLIGLFFIVGLFAIKGFSQTIIYSEDFTGQDNKGAIGPGGNNPTIDVSGVDWTIDVASVNLTADTDYFIVRTVSGNQLFEGRDLDASATWFSPQIDISGFTDIEFTIDASESNGTGGNNLENSDILLTEYRINGGTWEQASNNGSLSNDYDPTIVSQTGLIGSTLEIRVTITNNGGGERMRFDNVEVSGISCVESIPFTEGFEDVNFPPECWASFRGTNGLGTGFDWERSTAASNSGVASAFVRYEDVSEGNTAQDWLVTPPIDLGTSPTQLSFFGRQQFTNEWNTNYTVRISTTSQTDISSFSTLVTYSESDFGFTFSEKIVDLSSFTGIVYIAFVMEQDDGDNWYIDDITIDELPPCTNPDNVSNLSADYVNGSIDLSWSLGACYDELLIVARDGSAVTATPSGDGSAYTSDLNFGNGTEIVSNEFVVYQGGGNGTTITNVDFGSTYHFEVFTRKGTNWSSGVAVNITLDCTIDGDTSNGRFITQVEFNLADYDTDGSAQTFNLDNATPLAGTGYSDFTATVGAGVRRGDAPTLTVSVETNGTSFFGVHAFAWIDWNQDGIFSAATEQYDLGDANEAGATNLSPNILIPVDAVLGQTTMRIICRDRINPDGPCEDVDDGEIEDYTINILDAINYTYNNGWLPEDPNGLATIASDIVVETGDATISSNTSCNSFTVNPGATLTINTGVTLSIGDTEVGLTLESSSTEFSSLILNGTVSGTTNYERFVNVAGTSGSSGGNDLISMPLIPSSGQTFDEFINLGNPANSTKIFTNSVLYAFAPYNTSTKSFENFSVSGTDALELGKGYRVATNSGQNLTFTGDAETGDVLGVPISRPVNGSQWNLIGNPYPSYISSLDFVSTNADVIDDTGEAVYGYNSGTNSGSGTLNNYTIINNLTNSSVNIAPGQGFFIPVDNTPGFSDTVDFTSSMRTLTGSNDFILSRNEEPLHLRIQLSTSKNQSFTEIFFHENSSAGLDPGYDASVFGGTAGNFEIYSRLIQDNTGIDMAIQALHLTDLDQAVIPLGINTNKGIEFSLQIDSSNLPSDVDIYLQDTVTNTFTLLNSENYVLNPDTNLRNTGRFFLVFTRNSLSIGDKQLFGLEIYTSKNKEVVINGAINTKTIAKIYDLQGREILVQELNQNKNKNIINGVTLSNGIYIVNIINDNGSRSEKVILK